MDRVLDGAGKPTSTDANHKLQNFDLVHEFQTTVSAPFYNNLVRENVNIVPSLINDAGSALDKSAKINLNLHLPLMGAMEVAPANPNHPRAYIEQFSGGVGWLAGFLLTAKAQSGVSRRCGNSIAEDAKIADWKVGQFTRAAIRSEATNTVISAGIYDALRAPNKGETRFSNGLSSMVGFSAFEVGNKSIGATLSPLRPMSIAKRFTVGALAGMAQIETSSLLNTHKVATSDELSQAQSHGGILNILMPFAQKRGDATGASPVYADEWLKTQHEVAKQRLAPGEVAQPGSLAHKPTLQALYDAAGVDLLTTVRRSPSSETHVDHERNQVTLRAGDSVDNLAQEHFHRSVAKDPGYEESFKKAAAEIQSGQPELIANGRESYFLTRVLQEQAARVLQNKFIADLGMDVVPASVDPAVIRQNYGAAFAAEAELFVRSGGEYRPEIDHATRALLVNEYRVPVPKPRQTEYKTFELRDVKWNYCKDPSIDRKIANRDISEGELRYALSFWSQSCKRRGLLEEREQHETRSSNRAYEDSAPTIWFVAPANASKSRYLKVVAMPFGHDQLLVVKSAYDAKPLDHEDFHDWVVQPDSPKRSKSRRNHSA